MPTTEDPRRLVLVSYLEEESSDRRNVRWALAAAILVHLTFFAVHLPEFAVEVAESVRTPIFVVRSIPFRPPIAEPVSILTRRARRVPIPDPTPDAPEPFVQPVAELPVADIAADVVLLGLLPAPPAVESDRPVRYRSEMARPERISGEDPRYTEIARKARLEGAVILQAIIGKDGGVRDVEILKPLGLGLDVAAVEAVRKWRFRPALLADEPVDVIYSLTVRFALK